MDKRSEEFREYAHQFVDWMADYMGNVEKYPVKSQVKPKEIYDSINDDSLKKVAPFDLQGGRYGDWVIVVDIKALNSDSQKLWQNKLLE